VKKQKNSASNFFVHLNITQKIPTILFIRKNSEFELKINNSQTKTPLPFSVSFHRPRSATELAVRSDSLPPRVSGLRPIRGASPPGSSSRVQHVSQLGSCAVLAVATMVRGSELARSRIIPYPFAGPRSWFMLRDLINVVFCLCFPQPLRLEIKVRLLDPAGSLSRRRPRLCRVGFALISCSFCFLVLSRGSLRNGRSGSSRWICTPRSHGT
jgi:hypothetical protein